MFTNKTNWIVLVVALTVVALICSSVIAFKSIEEAKNENEAANTKIEELNDALDVLYEALESTKCEVLNHEERIKNYQEIIAAWSKATPDVSEAMKRITSSYEDVIIHVHLFDKSKLVGLEDEMMSAILSAIRSSDPLSFAASFEKRIAELNKTRFDNVFSSMVEEINKNGVTFPEDERGIKELRAYYDSFIENYAVIESFVVLEFDKKLENFEALLDGDEESDLANAFEDAVTQIKTPITLETVLDAANSAWGNLYSALETEDVLTEATLNARALLDGYNERVYELTLAKESADEINYRVSLLEIFGDVATKNAILNFENEIHAWVEAFNIDEANMYLIDNLEAVKSAYEKAVATLRELYEKFKAAVEGIGKVNVNSKSNIDIAFAAYEVVNEYVDVNILLALDDENTVESLFETLQHALERYNRLIFLVDSIRLEIGRMHESDPCVTHDDIAQLNALVDELLAFEVSINVLDTEKVDYVIMLEKARLMPHKNEAFSEIKDTYDAYYLVANNDRTIIISLVEIKDLTLNAIEEANSVEEIREIVEKAKEAFKICFE